MADKKQISSFFGRGAKGLNGSISLISSIGSISLQEKLSARWPGKTRGAIRFSLIFSPFLIKQKGIEIKL